MASRLTNDTRDVYWDNLAGDNLACHPANIAPGYEVACFFVTRVLASGYMLQALLFLYRTHLQVKMMKMLKRHRDKSAKANSVTISVPGTTTRENMSQRFRRRFDKLANLSFGIKVSLNAGITLTTFAVALYLGASTAYSNQDIRGQLADVLAVCARWLLTNAMCVAINDVRTTVTIHLCGAWYANLLQLRGVKYFQSLVRFPGDKPVDNKPSTSCSWLPSPTAILDECHGRLGALMAVAFLTLLFTERISRPVYYDTLQFLTLMFGMRSFIAIVTKRVSAMRRIAMLQNAAGGKADDKKRRQGTLRQKALQLAIDIVAVFVMSCGVPLSYLVARSHYSSRRYVMHLAVVLAFIFCTLTVGQVALHQSWQRSKKKMLIQSQKTGAKQGRTVSSLGSSLQSGLSIVEPSVVVKQEPGLFSELG